MIGIYKITNLINGKVYIGQSRDISKDGMLIVQEHLILMQLIMKRCYTEL